MRGRKGLTTLFLIEINTRLFKTKEKMLSCRKLSLEIQNIKRVWLLFSRKNAGNIQIQLRFSLHFHLICTPFSKCSLDPCLISSQMICNSVGLDLFWWLCFDDTFRFLTMFCFYFWECAECSNLKIKFMLERMYKSLVCRQNRIQHHLKRK